MISTRTKAEAWTEKGKEGAYPQSGLSASESSSEERYGHALVIIRLVFQLN